MDVRTESAQVLVIGAGLAGLNAAYEAALSGSTVTVAYKSGNRASPEIMGFSTPVSEGDSPELFLEELMESGEGLNRRELARELADRAEEQIGRMESIGLVFDKNADGHYNGMRALGNSFPRIVHYKALTGARSIKLLAERCRALGVRFLPDTRILELLREGDSVCGAVGVGPGGEPLVLAASAVVLASGGLSNMYPISTYPEGLLGDGYAIAARAGAEMVDMEFLQYEPCCFVYPEVLHGHLLVTTMLSEGAKLLNARGEEFMLKSGRGYKVQKGELSRAILREIREGRGGEHGGVFFDATALPKQRIVVDNSIFYEAPKRAGIDITVQPGEVAPAPHTFLGGVRIDRNCYVMPGLFAAGEVCGGVHGANRLGGCAGAEVFVFGTIAGQRAQEYAARNPADTEAAVRLAQPVLAAYETKRRGRGSAARDHELFEQIRTTIRDGLGAFRDEAGLRACQRGLDSLRPALDEMDGASVMLRISCENMIEAAQMQLVSSLARTESRGVFYRSDFPERDDRNWKKNILLRREGETLAMRIEDAD